MPIVMTKQIQTIHSPIQINQPGLLSSGGMWLSNLGRGSQVGEENIPLESARKHGIYNYARHKDRVSSHTGK